MLLFFKKLLVFSCLCFLSLSAAAQRSYKTSSVLATGNWFKISVDAAGVYKMDASFLNSLGISGSIPSNEIRVFGNGGGMLNEANSAGRIDDLEEISIAVFDGGDGTISGNDYILIYAQGPHQWLKDSLNQRFVHQKNIYADKAFYFITIGGAGKRISNQANNPIPTATANSFDERIFHELDSVNFLSSGKEWFGEEFSSGPGHTLQRAFNLNISEAVLGQPSTIIADVVSRSVNATSRFTVSINNQNAAQINLPGISAGTYDLFAQQAQTMGSLPLVQNSAAITFNYTPGSFNAQGWINWFRFFYRRNLSVSGNNQLLFRDWKTVGNSAVNFTLSNANSNTQVWDVTDPLHPVKMNTGLSGTNLAFVNGAMRLREYVAFSTAFLTPKGEGKVPNQNLHNTTLTDYLIITHPPFLQQAQRLAQFHQQKNNLKVTVVTSDQVFNEFSSGTPDPTAIRDFVKVYYDRYRTTWSNSGKYLLLFGKASFDFKNRIPGNTNFVPSYQSVVSLDPLNTYTSDDFFGFLDDVEDINSNIIINKLDIGIGRIPAKTVEEAKAFVDKVYDYHSAEALRPWRNNVNFIADDEDYNVHLQDAEVLSSTTGNIAPQLNVQKIYLDAFKQEGGSSGGRYPQVNEIVNNNIYNGTLIWNYSGHGGPQRLAEEVVIDQQIVNNWNNEKRLPLLITATCDFSPYDHPTVNSLGENLLIRPKTGAIALMTTTRVVFSFSNRIMNNNYLQIALQPDAAGKYKTLGQAMQESKNFTYQNSGDIANNRKFTLLGDPAMTLGFPQIKVQATTINGKSVATADTLSATEFVTIEGVVTDSAGTALNNFNGTVYLSLFDKPQTITTLANDATSQQQNFQTQTNTLFKGKASATNGQFSFKFRLPKDINYQFGNGKVSLYAQDGAKDGSGFTNNIIVGGISSAPNNDKEGPQIKAYLNDEMFVNGSITNENPVLILKLSDSSGINTGGSGIDHDIVATLDGDTERYFTLNDFYESDQDSYQSGNIRFQLPKMEAGSHTLKIKAWDVVNNSNEIELSFTVINDEDLKIDHVLNYPNPFTTNTTFWFEHNKPAVDLQTKIEIFTVTGKLVKMLKKTINTPGNRSSEIDWDGRDDYGAKLGRGVYIYRLSVNSADGKSANVLQRLVIL